MVRILLSTQKSPLKGKFYNLEFLMYIKLLFIEINIKAFLIKTIQIREK